MFNTLATILDLVQIEMPTFEPGQQFTLEPSEWGLLFSSDGWIIEIVEFLGQPIVTCGGSHKADGYSFIDCRCEICNQRTLAQARRLAQSGY